MGKVKKTLFSNFLFFFTFGGYYETPCGMDYYMILMLFFLLWFQIVDFFYQNDVFFFAKTLVIIHVK